MKITYKTPKNYLDVLMNERIQSSAFKSFIRRQMSYFFLLMLFICLLLIVTRVSQYILFTQVGIALVTLPFFPSFQRWVTRKHWRKLYKGHHISEGEKTLTLNKKGLCFKADSFELKYDWSEVHSLNQEGLFYSIVLHGLMQIHIPKKAIKGRKSKEAFEVYFRS